MGAETKNLGTNNITNKTRIIRSFTLDSASWRHKENIKLSKGDSHSNKFIELLSVTVGQV